MSVRLSFVRSEEFELPLSGAYVFVLAIAHSRLSGAEITRVAIHPACLPARLPRPAPARHALQVAKECHAN